MRVNVLGTFYKIREVEREKDKDLENANGYCDNTTKEIVIAKKDRGCNLGDFEVYRKKVLRHEIIHAFLFESGLHENFQHQEFGHEETVVDWIAVQYPKLQKAFESVGCLD